MTKFIFLFFSICLWQTGTSLAENSLQTVPEPSSAVLNSELTSEEISWVATHKVINFEQSKLSVTKENIPKVQLTSRERSWLKKHKSIKIAFDGSMPPYSFTNNTKQFEGIAVDIFNTLSDILGIQFQTFRETSWNTLYKKAARRQIDVIATMVDRPERQFWFNFTKPYIKKSLVIITNKNDQSLKHRSDLAGKKVALVKGYQYSQEVIKEFPSIKPKFVKSMLQGMKLVSQHKADAAIMFTATASYLQDKHQIDNLTIADFFDRNSTDESIAVRKDWPILAAILQKGLDSISEKQMNAIYSKWVAPTQTAASMVEVPSSITQVTVPPITPKTTVTTIEENKPTVSQKPLTAWPDSQKIEFTAIILAFLLLLRNQKKIKTANIEAQNANQTVLQLQSDIEKLITNRRAELSHHENTIRSLIENQNTEYFFYQYDCNGEFTYISPSITLILGYTPDDFKKNYRKYLTDNPVNQKVDSFMDECTNGIPNPPYQIEIYDNKRRIHWLEVSDLPVYDEYGICTGVDGVMHEITARKQAADHLVWLSYYDELTGLANRRLFMDRLQQSINLTLRKNLSFSLLFLDLDRFKSVNDTMGHTAGDEVLKEAARRMLSALRDSDVAARLGGDEFALLLPETNKEASVMVAEKIIKSLKHAYVLGEQLVNLGVSIGIAVYPDDGNNCEALIKQADSAMYYAKKKSMGFAFVPTPC